MVARKKAGLQIGGRKGSLKAVSEDASKRRWSGYVCPDCRLVFRIPMNHDGRGAVCPCCSRMLRIPRPDELTPPLSLSQPAKRPI